MAIVTNPNNLHRQAIVFAVVISTFTSLRFSFLGLGETVFLILGGIALLNLWKMPRFNYFIFSKFWLFYIFLCIVGTLYKKAAGLGTGTNFGVIFDTAAYLMLFISCLAIERRFVIHQDSAYSYLKLFFFFLASSLSLLFVLSFFTSSIAGLPLRYYQYFAPFVKNLHQVAMVLTPLPFIGLLLIQNEKKLLLKVIVVILIIMSLMMIVSTGASKAKLGVLLGIVAFASSYLFRSDVRYATIIIIAMFSGLLLYFTLFVDFALFFKELFDEHDGHGGRAYLYGAAIELIKESWVIGRGSGAHIYHLGEFNDTHQTLLTVLLQVGIIGFLFFVRLIFIVLKKAFYADPAVFASLASIMAYAAGGDILRRLPIWGVMMILFYTASQVNLKTKANK